MKLVCPHCNTSFQVDENDYAALVNQVRNNEFEADVKRRLGELRVDYELQAKEQKLQHQSDIDKLESAKNHELESLKTEIERLNLVIKNSETNKNTELANAMAKQQMEANNVAASKDKKILELESRLKELEMQHKLDIVEATNGTREELNNKELAIKELTSRLETQELASNNKILEIKRQNEMLLKAKDEEIEHYKDLKSRLSTKLLGESLEVHCHNMFNRARSQGQFPDAYFEKDNDVSGGTKGDFIFRDYIGDDEYISIMFEMKNEDENTVSKHRNEDFFAKLDKDRNAKHCEYAILVSTLEAESELYNEGIVDVSYRYPKMMVVRPQFFMAVITMISRAARRGAERLVSLQHELTIAKAQTVDVTKFEERRDKFVANFSKLVDAHIKKQDAALEALDKAIEQAERQANNLRKIKESFEMSKQKLLRANESAENDFTIKKLTHGNPTMKAMFEEVRRDKAASDTETLD